MQNVSLKNARKFIEILYVLAAELQLSEKKNVDRPVCQQIYSCAAILRS